MNKPMRLHFQKGDLLAVLLVALLTVLSVVIWFPQQKSEQNALVQVYLGGRLTQELPLSKDTEFTLQGNYTNTVRIHNGAVSVIASDCPGGDCMHSGAISHTGRSIVCLPNRAELRIVGSTSDVDFTVG